jgi:hypothetical protein
VPLIATERGGPCAACGGTIRRGEQAWYTREGGLRHVEPFCRNAAQVRFRPNQRAGTCTGCGTHVAASAGRLVYVPNSGASPWKVSCQECQA